METGAISTASPARSSSNGREGNFGINSPSNEVSVGVGLCDMIVSILLCEQPRRFIIRINEDVLVAIAATAS